MENLKNYYSRMVSAVVIALAFLMLASPAQAEWQTVLDPSIDVSQSAPLFDRQSRTYFSTVTVTNSSAAELAGELRIVVDSANKTVQNSDGATAANEPFFNLLTGAGAALQPGESASVALGFAGGRGRLIYSVRLENNPPVVAESVLEVSPDPLQLGDVFVGSSTSALLTIGNSGNAALNVTDVQTSGAPFSVFPPTNFSINDGDPNRLVSIGFSPLSEGDFAGLVTISSNAGPPVVVDVLGRGVLPEPDEVGDIQVNNGIDFGGVVEETAVEQTLTVSNTGTGPLTVDDATIDDVAFELIVLPGEELPFTLTPGGSRNLTLRFTPPLGSGGSTITGNLTINSDDPDEAVSVVVLSGNSIAPATVQLINNPVLGASVNGIIDASNCSNISGSARFGADSTAELFQVTLTDQGGVAVNSGFFNSPSGAGDVGFNGIDACGLGDGVLELAVTYGLLDPVLGTPAVKNTSSLSPPVLDPVEPVSVLSTIQVCGTSRESTTVRIEGGSRVVSTSLDASTTAFCLDVPLRSNTQNTLIAAAIDDLAVAPKPIASAEPVMVVHVDPSEIIIAEATSRPLTTEEVETLVQNGVINLDDPSNYNVSMFTIVLTIGSFPVTYTQPVPVPVTPGGTVSYGGGSGPGGGGWTGGGGSPGGTPTGCIVGCSQVVVINTPSGHTIPGVIIIDGRIKTLKEFFQVTIAIQNTSTGFDLIDMQADIELPSGLSPVRAGPGTDVADVNTNGEVDSVMIGEIGPGETGTGQFIIRGDGIGTHGVDVNFDGFLTGGGLPEPLPVSGSAGTSVQVFGPPELGVVVRHPSDVSGPDVVLNQIYELIVEITNLSPRPALYTSLELFVGGDAELVDAAGVSIPASNEVRSFGHIQPGQTVSAAFRAKSLAEGEIIACQAIASENISLTVDTGPDGTDCNIANTYPANFEPLPADMPPVVIGINPLNGQPNIPVTTSILATLTPESACLVADTWTNVVEALIDPLDPSKGWQVVSANLDTIGTFYLEELDAFDNPVRHIPAELYVEHPPAGGTTIAVLRLGLDVPHLNSQYFLSDNPATTYRATLVGGLGGVCSDASGAEMENSFSWTFSTEQTCSGVASPTASLVQPMDGSIERPLNQNIVLEFSQSMNPASFSFVPFDLGNSNFSVYQDAIDDGSGDIDITVASPVAGSGVFGNLNRTLTYTPGANFPEDTKVHVRLTDGIRDACGNPLQTPPNGVKLFSFDTIPPDTTPPALPQVNPVAALTNLPTVQVSGSAEASSTVTILGGAAPVNTAASALGLFNVAVPLNLDQSNTLQVQATDASNNSSALINVDLNGDPLVVVNDSTSPGVLTVAPANGAADVLRDATVHVEFNELIDPATLNSLNFTLEGSVIPGNFAPVGDSGFTFTPDNLLNYNTTYTVRMRANGIRDLAGNGLASEFVASFITEDFPLPVVTAVVPDSGVQGSSFQVTISGNNLATANGVISDNPGISGSLNSATDGSVVASITIDSMAATGMTTLGLTTLGGSASVPFTVLHKAPVVTAIVPGSGDQGATVAAQIQGSGLTDIIGIVIDGAGVAVVDLGTGSDSTRDVQFVIDAAATVGARTVTVTTPGGSDTGTFTVLEFNPAPTLTSIIPNSGTRGTTVSVTFNGTNLATASAVVAANPQVIGVIVSTTDTTVVANITIGATATLGATQLGLTTAGGSATLPFTVNAPVVPPIISSIVPNTGVQGTTVASAINGLNLTPVTGLTTDCAEVSVNNLGTGNSTRIDVEFVIGATVTPGLCTVTVTTLGGSASSGFTVAEAPDTIVLIPSPAQMLTRASLTMTVTLNAPAPAGGQVIDLSASDTIVTLPPTVTVLGGQLSANFDIESDVAIGSVDITASAVGFTGNTSMVDVVIRDLNLSSPLVGIDRTVTATISLPQPAPLGGASFDLSVADTNVATVSPVSITIPQGQSSGTFELTGGLTIGFTTVTADGSANGYTSETLDISVTDRLIDLPTAKDLSLGQAITLPLLIAPDAAPVGGVEVTVESSNPALVEVLTPTVTVLEGTFQASVQIRALGSATGTAIITASNSGFAPDTTLVSVSAGLNIIQSSVEFDSTGADTAFLELISGGEKFPAPAGGVEVTLVSADPSCATVPTLITIPEGSPFGSAALNYGGGAALPCTTTVTANSAIFGSDTLTVTVANVPDIGTLLVDDNHFGDNRVGSDLQIPYRIILDNSGHGGVTVQVKSSDPTTALVAPDASTPGTPVVELVVPAGQTQATFYLQGVTSSTGNVTLSATQSQFTTGTLAIDVVQPVTRLSGLVSSTTSLSADDPFRVETGYLHSNGTSFRYASVSATGGSLTMNLSSSDTGVGQLTTVSTTGSPVSVDIPVNQRFSPSTVATGGVAFDPLTGGTTTVATTAPGFDAAYAGSSSAVTVTQPGLSLADVWWGDERIGGGLQATYRVTLGASEHGGVTVHIESNNSSTVLLSSNATSAGSASIDLVIPNGQTTANFYVHGVSGATGSATLTASQALFTGDSLDVDVVQPVMRLNGLITSTTTLSADDPFRVETGYIHSNGSSFRYANVNATSGPVTVNITSSDTGVGELVTTASSGSPVTVEVAANQRFSPSTVAAGGAALNPIGGGSTTVAATATGFDPAYAPSSAVVTVTQPGMTLQDIWWGDERIGAGLQAAYRVTLGAPQHGGVTVHIESDNSSVLLSPNTTTAGTAAVDLVIPNGQTTATFYVHGVSGATGSATLTATQALFSGDTLSVEVVQSVMRLNGLVTSTTSLSADDPFRVETGYIHSNGVSFRGAPISASNGPLTVNFTSSDTGVGQLVTTATTGSPVTVDIAVNQRFSPGSVAAGGVALDPVSGGTTTVAATATGFDAGYAPSSSTVTISQPGMTLSDIWWGDARIGGGLQASYRVILGAPQHGGVVVHIESSSASTALLSADPTLAGTSAIDLVIPNGQTIATFYVQGVSGATGTTTLTASQALFTGATLGVEVVQPVMRLSGLITSTTSLSTDDLFRAETGYIHSNGTTFRYANVSAVGGPLTVNFTSSDTGVGQLTTTTTTGSPVTADIPVNQRLSPNSVAAGGVAFDPVGSGSTTVAATATGFNAGYAPSSAVVTVSQPGIALADIWFGDKRIGGGLQAPYRVTLGGSAHGGVTVRVASSDTIRMLVAANATTAGSAFIDIFIPDGQTQATFYVQGVNGVTGIPTLTASSALFTDGTLDVEVVQGVTYIHSLDTTTTAGAADDPFRVRTGYVHSNGSTFRYASVSPAGPLQILVSSSDAGVGQLKTAAETGAFVTVEIAVNAFDSPSTVATGGVAFDPVTADTTTISTNVIGFNNSWHLSTDTVAVSP